MEQNKEQMNLTPKEKALWLFHQMYYAIPSDELMRDYDSAKKCALIAVDEILEITSESYDIDHIKFWQEVKQEIELL